MDITKSGITQQSLVRINWNFGTKGKTDFSWQSKNVGPYASVFSRRLTHGGILTIYAIVSET